MFVSCNTHISLPVYGRDGNENFNPFHYMFTIIPSSCTNWTQNLQKWLLFQVFMFRSYTSWTSWKWNLKVIILCLFHVQPVYELNIKSLKNYHFKTITMFSSYMSWKFDDKNTLKNRQTCKFLISPVPNENVVHHEWADMNMTTFLAFHMVMLI